MLMADKEKTVIITLKVFQLKNKSIWQKIEKDSNNKNLGCKTNNYQLSGLEA